MCSVQSFLYAHLITVSFITKDTCTEDPFTLFSATWDKGTNPRKVTAHFQNNAKWRTLTLKSVSLGIETQCNKTAVSQYICKYKTPAQERNDLREWATSDGNVIVGKQFKVKEPVHFVFLRHYSGLKRSSHWNFISSNTNNTTVWFNFNTVKPTALLPYSFRFHPV